MKIELEGTYTNICDQMAEFLKGSAYVVTTVAEQVVAEADRGPVERIDSRPKKASRAKAPEPEPVVTDNEEAPEEIVEETVTPEAEKAVALLKLKDQQLSRLRDLFNAGKGPLVRQLLAKYGDGAKVFPEVDAKHFPAIKIELDRELGAH
jgi:hypothetical protein